MTAHVEVEGAADRAFTEKVLDLQGQVAGHMLRQAERLETLNATLHDLAAVLADTLPPIVIGFLDVKKAIATIEHEFSAIEKVVALERRIGRLEAQITRLADATEDRVLVARDSQRLPVERISIEGYR